MSSRSPWMLASESASAFGLVSWTSRSLSVSRSSLMRSATCARVYSNFFAFFSVFFLVAMVCLVAADRSCLRVSAVLQGDDVLLARHLNDLDVRLAHGLVADGDVGEDVVAEVPRLRDSLLHVRLAGEGDERAVAPALGVLDEKRVALLQAGRALDDLELLQVGLPAVVLVEVGGHAFLLGGLHRRRGRRSLIRHRPHL